MPLHSNFKAESTQGKTCKVNLTFTTKGRNMNTWPQDRMGTGNEITTRV